jgi:hypothetical protein
MGTSTPAQTPDATRPYILYRPAVASKVNGPRGVYLYTDGGQPDAFLESMALGRRFAAHVPGATIAVTLELRHATSGVALDQNSSSADVRGALDRAVSSLGWTATTYAPA